MAVTVYGIKTCDTMRKAFAWLDGHGVAYTFHEYRVQGIDRMAIRRWCEAAGWDKVLNRASTTFRSLPDSSKSDIDEEKAIALMLAEPTMIKRPILETGAVIEVGFRPERYETILGR